MMAYTTQIGDPYDIPRLYTYVDEPRQVNGIRSGVKVYMNMVNQCTFTADIDLNARHLSEPNMMLVIGEEVRPDVDLLVPVVCEQYKAETPDDRTCFVTYMRIRSTGAVMIETTLDSEWCIYVHLQGLVYDLTGKVYRGL